MSGLGYLGRGYRPSKRRTRRREVYVSTPRKRARLGPKANSRQVRHIKHLYRHGYSNKQISRTLSHPKLLKSTKGKKLSTRRVAAVTKKSSRKMMVERKRYLARLRDKWSWKYGGKKLPPQQHRLWGLLARITNDDRFKLKLEQEGYTLP